LKGTIIVPDLILPPQSNAPKTTILDDRDDVVFTGFHQNSEECFDQAAVRDSARGQLPERADEATNRLPIFELANALFRQFQMECSGEVCLSRELSALLLQYNVPKKKNLDDGGTVAFTGPHQKCEDLLRVGSIDFQVHAALTGELLCDLPAPERILHKNDHSESADRLLLHRRRLASILVRFKELCAELAQEFERVDDRINKLFHQAVRPATNVASAPKPTATTSSMSVQSETLILSQEAPYGHAECADSLVDYMSHLLGRMLSREGDSVLGEDHLAGHSSRGRVSSEYATPGPTKPVLSAESPVSTRLLTQLPQRLT
jgi:hypothetical protein